MRVRFLGKDSKSHMDNSPALFATDRTDRRTYIARGWKVTDPEALADVGHTPDHETIIEIPEEVLDALRTPLRGGGALSRLIQPGPEFRQLFHSFEHTAFRLEVRDTYNVTYENEPLRKFLTDEADDLPWIQNWLTMICDAVGKGQRFARVRVVSLPLTDYGRFGVWCSQFNNNAGEDIRYLLRNQAERAGLPNHDYWLFDSCKLVRMYFDDANIFLGGEIIEDTTEIIKHNYWRDAAWHHAVRRDEFATEQNLRRL